ncbi:MAG: PKD domain-containing protein [Cyclobacteriaceae bacterium]
MTKMNMKSYFKSMMLFSLGLVMVATTSCGEDDPIDPPLAFFTAEVDASDNFIWKFTDGSQGAESYSWDFGDGSAPATDANPTYTYAAAGTYTVVLTATNAGGSDTHTETISVVSKEAVNELASADFADATGWTTQQFNTHNNAVVTIADGVLKVTEVDPDAGWGGEAHGGAWQAVTVEAGTYAFDIDVTTVAADELWAEIWVGNTEPVADDDYNGDDGATAVLILNTWDCAAQANHSGSLAADNCQKDSSDPKPNTIELTEGTHYVVIRTGGITFPADGVIFDNISMLKQ